MTIHISSAKVMTRMNRELSLSQPKDDPIQTSQRKIYRSFKDLKVLSFTFSIRTQTLSSPPTPTVLLLLSIFRHSVEPRMSRILTCLDRVVWMSWIVRRICERKRNDGFTTSPFVPRRSRFGSGWGKEKTVNASLPVASVCQTTFVKVMSNCRLPICIT